MSDEKVSWPAWFYGPNDAAEIFEKAEDVPAGWVDHPALVGTEKAPAKTAPAKTAAQAAAKKAPGRAKKTTAAPAPAQADKPLDL